MDVLGRGPDVGAGKLILTLSRRPLDSVRERELALPHAPLTMASARRAGGAGSLSTRTSSDADHREINAPVSGHNADAGPAS